MALRITMQCGATAYQPQPPPPGCHLPVLGEQMPHKCDGWWVQPHACGVREMRTWPDRKMWVTIPTGERQSDA